MVRHYSRSYTTALLSFEVFKIDGRKSKNKCKTFIMRISRLSSMPENSVENVKKFMGCVEDECAPSFAPEIDFNNVDCR